MGGTWLFILTLKFWCFSCYAFYLPARAPVTYCTDGCEVTFGEDLCREVSVYANCLSSEKSIMTYEYSKFDFCQAEDNRHPYTESLGQILSGDRLQKTPIKLPYKKDIQCQELCTKKYSAGDDISENTLNFTKNAIFLNYHQVWMLDDVPVTWCYLIEAGEHYCSRGFPVGCFVTSDGRPKDACLMSSRFYKKNTFYVFNHFDITITHRKIMDESGRYGRILSAHIEPKSDTDGCLNSKEVVGVPGGRLTQDLDIHYTYSVKWKEDTSTLWSDRWDYILENIRGEQTLLFSCINSVTVMLFTALITGKVILEAHNKCICKRNKVQLSWKLLYGDVFRPPRYRMMLSVFFGSGLQVFLAAYFTVVTGCVGFLSPANPGSVVQMALILYIVMAGPTGYMAARHYKTFGGHQPVLQTTLLAFFCPCISFLVFLIMDTVNRVTRSSRAVPFTSHLELFGFWLTSALLTAVGSFKGFKAGAKPVPFKTAADEKSPDIPRMSVLQRLTVLSGILVYGNIFVNQFFILNSIWFEQVYNHYVYLLAALTTMMLTAFMVAIISTYIHLSKKNYRWWWQGFVPVSTVGLYVFLYSLWYLHTKVQTQDGVSIVVFTGYSLLAGFLTFLATGALGFLASFCYVVHIYTIVQKEKDHDKAWEYEETERMTPL